MQKQKNESEWRLQQLVGSSLVIRGQVVVCLLCVMLCHSSVAYSRAWVLYCMEHTPHQALGWFRAHVCVGQVVVRSPGLALGCALCLRRTVCTL